MRPSLNCVVAGTTAAAATGAVVGLALTLPSLFMASFTGGLVARIAWPLMGLTYGATYGAILGALPGALVMWFSPARQRPWKALPYLLIGTIPGVFASLFAARFVVLPEDNIIAVNLVPVVMFALGPTLGGIIAAWLWGRVNTRDAKT